MTSDPHSTEFEYLNDVPILTLDVSEDFKGDQIKGADMIEKVSDGDVIMVKWSNFCLRPRCPNRSVDSVNLNC